MTKIPDVSDVSSEPVAVTANRLWKRLLVVLAVVWLVVLVSSSFVASRMIPQLAPSGWEVKTSEGRPSLNASSPGYILVPPAGYEEDPNYTFEDTIEQMCPVPVRFVDGSSDLNGGRLGGYFVMYYDCHVGLVRIRYETTSTSRFNIPAWVEAPVWVVGVTASIGVWGVVSGVRAVRRRRRQDS